MPTLTKDAPESQNSLTEAEWEELQILLEIENRENRQLSTDWREWLAINFPAVCTYPHGARHIRLWEWIESLTPGSRVPARVDVWPRGGGKSSVGELGVTRTGAKLSRRFALYLSETQDQANLHVQAIGTLMETLHMERAVNQYGNAKGWKVNLLRTANGFNVLALGLDSASRGVKLDQYRPDFILCDDLDNQSDTLDTVDKKIRTLTTAILPAGSGDCAVLFLQNKIHKNGIVAQLCDGRADFLHDREPAHEEPAVVGLVTGTRTNERGVNVYAITSGTATWEGQSLEICEKQINTWGLKAFRREAQHEVEDADGIFFRVSNIKVIKPDELPQITRVCLAWDLAATEAGGDYTCGVLLGLGIDGRYYILRIIRGQWSSERVRQVISLACQEFLPAYKGRRALRFPQDPGQAGKGQAEDLSEKFAQWDVPKPKVESGSKWTRATSWAEEINLGNVSVIEQDLPSAFAPFMESLNFQHHWQRFLEVYRNFKEDVLGQKDDEVDAGANSYNEIRKPRELQTSDAAYSTFWDSEIPDE